MENWGDDKRYDPEENDEQKIETEPNEEEEQDENEEQDGDTGGNDVSEIKTSGNNELNQINNKLKEKAKEKTKEAMKKMVKAAIKAAMKLALACIKIILPIIIVLIAFGACYYVFTLNEVSDEGEDYSSTAYAKTQYAGNITIDEDGTIHTAMTAQELWNKMVEEGNQIDMQLEDASELLKLMNAEIITNYLDTRPNPDEPIDWDSMNEDPEKDVVQGIVKLKRGESGSTYTMVYADPETFQSYIDKYNETGSEEDKQIALSHFTLEQGYNNIGIGQKITAGTTILIPSGLGSVHTYMGWQCITNKSSLQYKLIQQAGMNFDEEGYGRINGRYVIACTNTYGTVGDYIDFYQEDGTIIQCIIGDIKNQSDAGCNEWGHSNGTCIVEFVVDKDSWYSVEKGGKATSMHSNPGTAGNHPEWNKNIVQAVNGGSYFENPSFGQETITGNGAQAGENSGTTIGDEAMKWPADSTNITSYFGYRRSPTAGASTNHKGIDIGSVGIGSNIYATEAGTVTAAKYSDSAGYMVTIDHGNGYISKYMHNSDLKVKVGDKVAKGQVIALSGNTGVSTGPHLHFQIEYNGNPIDPLNFKYENGLGNGIAGIGSNPDALSTNGIYYAKVAVLYERTDTVESNDPEIPSYEQATYSMTTQKINYQDLIKEYQMPFEYLWSFLQISGKKSFVFELADLVYNSEIEITIQDNITTTTNITTDTYTKKEKTITDSILARAVYKDSSNQTKVSTERGGPYTSPEHSNDYKVVQTIVTKTNTIGASVTKANIWYMEYTQDYTYTQQVDSENTNVIENPDQPYPDTPNAIDNDPLGENVIKFKNEVITKHVLQGHSNIQIGLVNPPRNCHYYSTVNSKTTIHNKVESSKFTASPANIREKTDKNTDEKNFVTIFWDEKNLDAAYNINDGAEWLFELLKQNKNTVNMVDLTKYMLYKATGDEKTFDVKTYDFGTYDQSGFKTVDDNI